MKLIVNTKGHGNKFEKTPNVTRLYNEIRGFEVLTKDQERELFHILRTGNTKEKSDARNALCNCNMKLVVSIARAFANNASLEDLISEGAEGLLDAIDKFDTKIAYETDVKFSTFAIEYIRRNINLYMINHGTLVKQTNRTKTIHYLSRAKNSFMQKYERQPTSDELIDWLNENYIPDEKNKLDDPKDVEELQWPSIDEPIDNHTEQGSKMDSMLQLYNAATQQENDFNKVEDAEYSKELLELLLKDLSKRDRDIIKMTFGIGYSHPLSAYDIAERTSLTPERVRQIRAEVIKQLKHAKNKCFKTL